MIRKIVALLSLFLLLGLLMMPAAAQDQFNDSDADSVPDAFDSCPDEVGLPQNNGCPAGVEPDFDGDGIVDWIDLCFDSPGEEAFLGCTSENFPAGDFDGDGVADPLDSCFSSPGLPENDGCPEGTVPDFDEDGVPNTEDACPRQWGTPENNGCVVDSDGDIIPDEFDTCPDAPGRGENYGCPEGTSLPDEDGDGVADMGDSCPQEAGPPETGGCPDSDNDGVPDNFDSCPGESGSVNLDGCPPVENASLPANRAVITTENAAQVTELGALSVGAYHASLPMGQYIALHTPEEVLIYDLSSSELAPQPIVAPGGISAASATGGVLAALSYPLVAPGTEATEPQPPSLSLWDLPAATQRMVLDFAVPSTRDLALSADGNLLATAHGLYFDPEAGEVPDFYVRLWNTADGTLLAELEHETEVNKVAFSPDGRFLLAQNTDEVSVVWDVANRSIVQVLQEAFSPTFFANTNAFSPDGSLLATGGMDGTVMLWETGGFSQVNRLPLFDPAADEMVTALAFNPAGNLLAVAGSPLYAMGDPASSSFRVLLVDVASGEVLATLSGHNRLVINVGFSGDGTLLTTVGDVSTRFWGIAQ